jgi:hypothetical protein
MLGNLFGQDKAIDDSIRKDFGKQITEDKLYKRALNRDELRAIDKVAARDSKFLYHNRTIKVYQKLFQNSSMLEADLCEEIVRTLRFKYVNDVEKLKEYGHGVFLDLGAYYGNKDLQGERGFVRLQSGVESEAIFWFSWAAVQGVGYAATNMGDATGARCHGKIR